MHRADFYGWAASKEFAATAYNISLRRAQMWAVCSYVRSNKGFNSVMQDLQSLSPKDFVMSALAAGECSSIRAALRKKNVDTKVKTVLQSMQFVLRTVEGSESERDLFRFKFAALRLWNGCSIVFFTLNPHDSQTPLLIHFIGEREEHLEKACPRATYVLIIDWKHLFLLNTSTKVALEYNRMQNLHFHSIYGVAGLG